jgi:hypothetical protein
VWRWVAVLGFWDAARGERRRGREDTDVDIFKPMIFCHAISLGYGIGQ